MKKHMKFVNPKVLAETLREIRLQERAQRREENRKNLMKLMLKNCQVPHVGNHKLEKKFEKFDINEYNFLYNIVPFQHTMTVINSYSYYDTTDDCIAHYELEGIWGDDLYNKLGLTNKYKEIDYSNILNTMIEFLEEKIEDWADWYYDHDHPNLNIALEKLKHLPQPLWQTVLRDKEKTIHGNTVNDWQDHKRLDYSGKEIHEEMFRAHEVIETGYGGDPIRIMVTETGAFKVKNCEMMPLSITLGIIKYLEDKYKFVPWEFVIDKGQIDFITPIVKGAAWFKIYSGEYEIKEKVVVDDEESEEDFYTAEEIINKDFKKDGNN